MRIPIHCLLCPGNLGSISKKTMVAVYGEFGVVKSWQIPGKGEHLQYFSYVPLAGAADALHVLWALTSLDCEGV